MLPDRSSSRSAVVYDPLLDEYEPGATTADLADLFARCGMSWCPWWRRSPRPAERAITGRWPDPCRLHRRRLRSERSSRGLIRVDRQRIFGEAVAAAVGFDFQRGRLDVTAHPFCTGHRAGRLPDHHPVRRAQLHRRVLRHPPRGRPRPVRAGAWTKRTTARRWGRRSRWECTSRSRGSGKTPWPRPGVLDLLVPHGPPHLPRGA